MENETEKITPIIETDEKGVVRHYIGGDRAPGRELVYAAYPSGREEWFADWNGTPVFHRYDGPAIIHASGYKEWFIGGHPLKGQSPDGSIFFLDKFREKHSDVGPAVRWADGSVEWWVHGVRLDTEEEAKAEVEKYEVRWAKIHRERRAEQSRKRMEAALRTLKGVCPECGNATQQETADAS